MDTREGIRSIQSILRKATQSNLSLFHNAGNITGESIFPRPSVKDILNFSQSASCSSSASVSQREGIRKLLIGTKFQDFVIGYSISSLIDNEAENVWYLFNGHEMPSEFVRFYLDPRKVSSVGLTLNEIAERIFDKTELYCSPEFMGIIDVTMNSLNELASILSHLSSTIGGDQRIKDAVVIDDKVHTIGSSIKTLLEVDAVDNNSIVSNNIADVESIYGIEAARGVIDDLLDDEHSGTVADFMTRSGRVLGLDKSNLELYRRGFISCISLERSREEIRKLLFTDASFDPVESIYAKIWAGLKIR